MAILAVLDAKARTRPRWPGWPCHPATEIRMLTIGDIDRKFGRRDFLRVGGLALGGLTLPGLLAARAAAAQSGMPVTDKSVIFIFLHGGPSQIETFDPKLT